MKSYYIEEAHKAYTKEQLERCLIKDFGEKVTTRLFKYHITQKHVSLEELKALVKHTFMIEEEKREFSELYE